MALILKLSQAVRNARLDSIEIIVSAQAVATLTPPTATGPILEIWGGGTGGPGGTATPPPADCAAADAGSGAAVLCSMSLPPDWMAAASGGGKSKSGTWSGVGSVAAGTGIDATHFRIKQGGTCHIQGSAGEAGIPDTPDMVLDNKNIAQNQAVTVINFTLVDGNF